MPAAMSRQNARQSARRKGYYERQYDRTATNKTIAMIRHLANYGMGNGFLFADPRTANKIRDEKGHHLTLVRNKLKTMGASRLLFTLDGLRA